MVIKRRRLPRPLPIANEGRRGGSGGANLHHLALRGPLCTAHLRTAAPGAAPWSPSSALYAKCQSGAPYPGNVRPCTSFAVFLFSVGSRDSTNQSGLSYFSFPPSIAPYSLVLRIIDPSRAKGLVNDHEVWEPSHDSDSFLFFYLWSFSRSGSGPGAAVERRAVNRARAPAKTGWY